MLAHFARPVLSLLRDPRLVFAAGLGVLLAAGLGAPGTGMAHLFGQGNYLPLDVVCGLVGFWFAFRAISPAVRLVADDRNLRRDLGEDAHSSFVRSGRPQQLYLLLLAVARAGGETGREAETVRTFLRERLGDEAAAELQDLATGPLAAPDLMLLARRVGRGLKFGERATIYSWSCVFAVADRRLAQREVIALHRIASGLGLGPAHAEILAQFARRANGKADDRRSQQRPHEQRHERRQHRPEPSTATSRERALATLGLPRDATPEQIRQRHRELARRFHPDAHRQLGAIAREEATERFVAIQRAYEELSR